jgi:triosephosphate isomerase
MKHLIVANWKMNPSTFNEAEYLFNEISERLKDIKNIELVICPPFPYIGLLAKINNTKIKLGAQNCFWLNSGPFTGQVSPYMLKNLGVSYVILGHSETRKHGNEKDFIIRKKIKSAIENGLTPILCIAKKSQIPKNLKENIIIAFEPISAIGTGKPYPIERAKKIRNDINHPFVLYGGSVDEKNAVDFIDFCRFQGLLVGGASLSAKTFVSLVRNVSKLV